MAFEPYALLSKFLDFNLEHSGRIAIFSGVFGISFAAMTWVGSTQSGDNFKWPAVSVFLLTASALLSLISITRFTYPKFLSLRRKRAEKIAKIDLIKALDPGQLITLYFWLNQPGGNHLSFGKLQPFEALCEQGFILSASPGLYVDDKNAIAQVDRDLFKYREDVIKAIRQTIPADKLDYVSSPQSAKEAIDALIETTKRRNRRGYY